MKTMMIIIIEFVARFSSVGSVSVTSIEFSSMKTRIAAKDGILKQEKESSGWRHFSLECVEK